jgi:pyrophosphatase PpaX
MSSADRHAPAAFWICDVNGVLIDSMALVRAAFAATAARFRMPPVGHKLRELNGYVLLDAYRALDPGGNAAARAAYHLSYVRERLADVTAYPDVADTLADAADAGVRVVAVTSYGEIAEACLVHTRLYRFLDGLVTQEEVTRRKPEPDLLARALDLFGPDRDAHRPRAVYVGDTPLDVETGRNAGIRTVGAAYGFAEEAEIRAARPDHVIGAFAAMRDFLPARSTRPALTSLSRSR